MKQECKYRNCMERPEPGSSFCGPRCERWYYRETTVKKTQKIHAHIEAQRKKRRKLIEKVVTGCWKGLTELSMPLRIEGYNATYRTLRRDLELLIEDGIVEKRVTPARGPGTGRWVPFAEYRNPKLPCPENELPGDSRAS